MKNLIFLTFLLILGLVNSFEVKNEKLKSLIKEANDKGELDDNLKEQIQAELRAIVEPSVIDPLITNLIRPLFPDPILIPDIPIGENITISDVRVEGAGTIHRVGDIDMEFQGILIIMKGHLGLNDLKISLRAVLELLGLPIDANISLGLGWIDIIGTIRARIIPISATVDEIMLQNTGPLDFNINGLGPILDLIANPVVNFLGSLIKELLVRILSPLMVDIINELLRAIGIPPANYDGAHLRIEGGVEERIRNSFIYNNTLQMKHNNFY